jgi:hypothetical protein
MSAKKDESNIWVLTKSISWLMILHTAIKTDREGAKTPKRITVSIILMRFQPL